MGEEDDCLHPAGRGGEEFLKLVGRRDCFSGLAGAHSRHLAFQIGAIAERSDVGYEMAQVRDVAVDGGLFQAVAPSADDCLKVKRRDFVRRQLSG